MRKGVWGKETGLLDMCPGLLSCFFSASFTQSSGEVDLVVASGSGSAVEAAQPGQGNTPTWWTVSVMGLMLLSRAQAPYLFGVGI